MKLPLYIIAACLLVGCGPTAKLKRAEHLIRQAIAQGAKVDSLTKVVHDTIHTKSVEKEVKIVPQIDTVLIVEKCKEVVKKANKTRVRNLQKEICPDTSATLSHDLEIVVQGKVYRVPVKMAVSSRNGVLMGALEIKRTEIPFVSEKTTVGVSSGFTLWGVIWRCAALGLLTLIVGFVIGRFTKISV